MDELDSAILRELQADARLTNRELASRLGLAPSTCLVHVAIPTISDMRALLMDRSGKRKEVVGFRTSIICEHRRRLSIDPAEPDGVPGGV